MSSLSLPSAPRRQGELYHMHGKGVKSKWKKRWADFSGDLLVLYDKQDGKEKMRWTVGFNGDPDKGKCAAALSAEEEKEINVPSKHAGKTLKVYGKGRDQRMVFAASSMPEKVHWVATMELSMGLIKTGVVTAMDPPPSPGHYPATPEVKRHRRLSVSGMIKRSGSENALSALSGGHQGHVRKPSMEYISSMCSPHNSPVPRGRSRAGSAVDGRHTSRISLTSEEMNRLRRAVAAGANDPTLQSLSSANESESEISGDESSILERRERSRGRHLSLRSEELAVVKRLVGDLQQVEGEGETLLNQRKELQSMVAAMQSEKQSLVSSLEEKAQNLTRMEEETAVLRQELATQQKALQQLQEDKKAAVRALQSAESQLSSSQKEVESVTSATDHQIEQLQRELEKSRKGMDELQNILQRNKNEMKRLQEELITARHDAKIAQETLLQREKDLQDTRRIQEQLRNETTQHQQQLAAENKSLRQQVAHFERLNADNADHLRDLEEETAQYVARTNNLKRNLLEVSKEKKFIDEKWTLQVDGLKAQHAQRVTTVMGERDDWKRRFESLLAEREKTANRVGAKDSEMEGIKKDLEAARADKTRLNQEVANLLQENKRIQQGIQADRERKKAAADEAHVNIQVASLREKLDHAEKQVADTEERLKRVEEELAKVEKQFKESEDKLGYAEQKIKGGENMLRDVEEKLANASQSLKKLEKDIGEERKELRAGLETVKNDFLAVCQERDLLLTKLKQEKARTITFQDERNQWEEMQKQVEKERIEREMHHQTRNDELKQKHEEKERQHQRELAEIVKEKEKLLSRAAEMERDNLEESNRKKRLWKEEKDRLLAQLSTQEVELTALQQSFQEEKKEGMNLLGEAQEREARMTNENKDSVEEIRRELEVARLKYATKLDSERAAAKEKDAVIISLQKEIDCLKRNHEAELRVHISRAAEEQLSRNRLEEDTEEMKKSIKERNEQSREINKRLQEYRGRIEALEEENEVLNQSVREEASARDSQLCAMNHHLADLQQQLEEVGAELQQETTAGQKLREEIEALNEKETYLREQTNERQLQQVKEMENENAQQRQQHEEDMKKKIIEIEELKLQLSNLQRERDDLMQGYTATFRSVEEKNKQLVEEKSLLEAELKELREDKERSEQEKNQFQEEIERLLRQLSSREKAEKSIMQENKKWEDELRAVRKEQTRLEEETQSLSIKWRDCKKENETLKKEKALLEQKLQSLRMKKRDKENEKDIVNKEKEHVIRENEVLKKSNSCLTRENDTLKKENSVLEGSNDALMKEKNVLEKAYDAIKKQNTVLEEENHDLKRNTVDFEEENETLRTAKRDLEEELRSVRNENSDTAAKNDLRETIEKDLNGEVHSLRENNITLEGRIHSLQKEKSILEEEARRLKKEMGTMEEATAVKLTSLRDENREMEIELEQEKHHHRDLKEEFAALLSRFTEQMNCGIKDNDGLTSTLENSEESKEKGSVREDLLALLREKEEAIERLLQHRSMRDEDQKQIKEMREAFDSFREKALLREGQISRAYLEEAKALRKEYFYSLAVGVKLSRMQEGVEITRDIASIYDQHKDKHFTKWRLLLSEYKWNDGSSSPSWRSTAPTERVETKQRKENARQPLSQRKKTPRNNEGVGE